MVIKCIPFCPQEIAAKYIAVSKEGINEIGTEIRYSIQNQKVQNNSK